MDKGHKSFGSAELVPLVDEGACQIKNDLVSALGATAQSNSEYFNAIGMIQK